MRTKLLVLALAGVVLAIAHLLPTAEATPLAPALDDCVGSWHHFFPPTSSLRASGFLPDGYEPATVIQRPAPPFDGLAPADRAAAGAVGDLYVQSEACEVRGQLVHLSRVAVAVQQPSFDPTGDAAHYENEDPGHHDLYVESFYLASIHTDSPDLARWLRRTGVPVTQAPVSVDIASETAAGCAECTTIAEVEVPAAYRTTASYATAGPVQGLPSPTGAAGYVPTHHHVTHYYTDRGSETVRLTTDVLVDDFTSVSCELDPAAGTSLAAAVGPFGHQATACFLVRASSPTTIRVTHIPR